MISFKMFEEVYNSAVKEVLHFFDYDKMAAISKHNFGWHPDSCNISDYLFKSSARYWEAYKLLAVNADTGAKVIDVGGFYGPWALCLSRIGYQVTIAERYDYYYGAFDALRKYLEGEGVSILNKDFSAGELKFEAQYDIATCMAVLEHIPGAPKNLLTNIDSAVSKSGLVVLEVPNIAFWPKRFDLLKGISPHPPFDQVFKSAQPFCGHYREYSLQDLEYVNNYMGWQVQALHTFNYTGWPKGNWKQKLLLEWPTNKFASCREVLISLARKS